MTAKASSASAHSPAGGLEEVRVHFGLTEAVILFTGSFFIYIFEIENYILEYFIDVYITLYIV